MSRWNSSNLMFVRLTTTLWLYRPYWIVECILFPRLSPRVQTIDGAISLALCPQAVSESTPLGHFRSSETLRATWGGTLPTSLSARSFPLVSGMSKTVHLRLFSLVLLALFRCCVSESRGGRPGLSVLTSLMVSVDIKLHWTMLTHWSQLVPNMSTDLRGH